MVIDWIGLADRSLNINFNGPLMIALHCLNLAWFGRDDANRWAFLFQSLNGACQFGFFKTAF